MEIRTQVNGTTIINNVCQFKDEEKPVLEKHIYDLIKNNQVTCYKCSEPMRCTPTLHTTRYGFICNNCSKQLDNSLEHCKFHSFGCNYLNDSQWIRRKHEEWMCSYNDKDCWKCRMKYLHARQLDHWSQNHCKTLYPQTVGNSATTTYSGIKHGESHFSINVHEEFVYVQLAFTAHNISIWLVMDADEHSDDRYTCSYQITFPAEDVVFKRDIPRNDSFGFDWFDVLPIDAKMSDRIDLQLTITKRE